MDGIRYYGIKHYIEIEVIAIAYKHGTQKLLRLVCECAMCKVQMQALWARWLTLNGCSNSD